MTMTTTPEYETKQAAADRLGISVRTVDRMIACGDLPALKWRNTVRLRVGDLDRLMSGHHVQ